MEQVVDKIEAQKARIRETQRVGAKRKVFTEIRALAKTAGKVEQGKEETEIKEGGKLGRRKKVEE